VGQAEGVLEDVLVGWYRPWAERLVDWLLEVLELSLSLAPKGKGIGSGMEGHEEFL
jgi:hypothetical protein